MLQVEHRASASTHKKKRKKNGKIDIYTDWLTFEIPQKMIDS